MITKLIFFLMLIFKDTFVRLGASIGIFIGFLLTSNYSDNLVLNLFVYGFIGWVFGVYIGHNYNFKKNSFKKSKFKVYQGRK